MEFKYAEITMHVTLGLMHVVNGSPLVEPLEWLSVYRRKVAILFAKDPLV